MFEQFAKCKSKVIRHYHKYKDGEFIYIFPFVLLSLNVRLRYFFFLLTSGQGFPQSDDSKWYINYAHTLMNNAKIGLNMNDILYAGYNILLTFLLAVFQDTVTVIFIQTVTAGLSVILVYKIAHRLFNRTTAIIASFFYSYYSWSITLWSVYILSDSFFISLLLLCVYFLLKFMESEGKIYRTLFAVTAVYLLIFRPAGMLTMMFIAVSILINTPGKTLVDGVKKYRLALGGCLTAAAAAFVYMYAGGKLDPLIGSMQYNAKLVLYNIYAQGWIYDKPSAHDHHFRPDYTINVLNSVLLSFFINNWDHIFIIYAKRMIAFLGRWVWETDVTSLSGVIKFADRLFPIVLFLTGTAAAIRNKLFRKASVVWLIILSVAVFCIIFFIDGMYRYKAPSIPFIAIIVAYGTERLIHSIVLIVKKLYATAALPHPKEKKPIP